MQTTRATVAIVAVGLSLAVTMGVVGSTHVTAKESGGAAPMSAAQTRAVMAAYTDALAGDGALAAYLAEDASLTLVDEGQQVEGRAAVAAALAALHHGAFEARSRVTNVVVGDGQATLEAELVGTQVGTYAGVPPTGRVVRVPYAACFELRGGRIAAVRLYFPTAAARRQLGGKPRIQ